MKHLPSPDVNTEEGRHGMRSDLHWTIDKHIPVALIIMILVQTGGALWWAATISGRVEVLERQTVASAAAVVATATASSTLSERLVKLETKFDGAIEKLNDITTLLRQVPTRSSP